MSTKPKRTSGPRRDSSATPPLPDSTPAAPTEVRDLVCMRFKLDVESTEQDSEPELHVTSGATITLNEEQHLTLDILREEKGGMGVLLEASCPARANSMLELIDGLSLHTYTLIKTMQYPQGQLCDMMQGTGADQRRVYRWFLPMTPREDTHYCLTLPAYAAQGAYPQVPSRKVFITFFKDGSLPQAWLNEQRVMEAVLFKHFGSDYINTVHETAMEHYAGSTKALAFRLAALLPSEEERRSLTSLLKAQSNELFAQLTQDMPDWVPPITATHGDNKNAFRLRYAILTRVIAVARLLRLEASVAAIKARAAEGGDAQTAAAANVLASFAEHFKALILTETSSHYWAGKRSDVYNWGSQSDAAMGQLDYATLYRALPTRMLPAEALNTWRAYVSSSNLNL